MSFFVLMSGLGTVAALAGRLPYWAKIDPAVIAALTSTVGALQLVFGFTRLEAQHADLRRQFLRLLTEMSDGDHAAVMKKGRALLTGELPTYFVINALAYNAAQARFDRPVEYNLRVTLRQRVFGHILRFAGTQFPRLEEVRADRARRREALKRWMQSLRKG